MQIVNIHSRYFIQNRDCSKLKLSDFDGVQNLSLFYSGAPTLQTMLDLASLGISTCNVFVDTVEKILIFLTSVAHYIWKSSNVTEQNKSDLRWRLSKYKVHRSFWQLRETLRQKLNLMFNKHTVSQPYSSHQESIKGVNYTEWTKSETD